MSSSALTERRNGDRKHVQAVIEIHSEPLLGHQRGEVLIGCGHDAHIDATGMRAAQPFEFLLLQDPQQLRLQFERNIADLIQEQRAAVRRLETAHLLRHRAREGALFMTEELAFEESQRNRRAVQLYERPIPAPAVVVDGLRDELFSGTCFAFDENGGVGWATVRI